jgi:hypothetical protein
MLRACVFEARVEESARFDRARRAASTNCEGLLEGHKFERMAGKTDADCRGLRKDGSPNAKN